MKRARVFFWHHHVQGYVHAPDAIVRAFPEGSFNYDDKIEVLALKRIDMTDEEFAALPVIDSRRVTHRPKR